MHLTVRTNIAMRALMFCAVNRARLVRKQDIARACNVSENHLGVVVNRLGHAGVLTTMRGRNGGLRLARAPEAVSVGEVVRLFETAVPFAECFGARGSGCPLVCACRLRGALGRAVEGFYAALDGVTLADLVDENAGLSDLLTRTPA